MKILVDYDKTSGFITIENGETYITRSDMSVTEHKQNSDIVEMIKLGATPDEIIKLKHNGVIS